MSENLTQQCGLVRWTDDLVIGALVYEWCEFKLRRGRRENFQLNTLILTCRYWDHCVFCPSSSYGFWFSHWFLQIKFQQESRFWFIKKSVTLPVTLYCNVCSKWEVMCICVRVSILPIYMIFQWDFGTVTIVWYFLFFNVSAFDFERTCIMVVQECSDISAFF